MSEKKVGAVCVLENDRLVFSERDLVTRVVIKSLDPKTTLVAQVMTQDIEVANPDETQEDCRRKMQQAKCGTSPLSPMVQLLGVISVRDLPETELNEKTEELRIMNTSIMSRRQLSVELEDFPAKHSFL